MLEAMNRPTSAHTSFRMSRVRSRNTGPELIVRKIVRDLGFRYRLHKKDLAGTPDIVFPPLQCIVLVNGCFWHRHRGCPRASVPATRTEYWLDRFARNISRDAAVLRALRKDGWRVLVVWECQTRDHIALKIRLYKFLTHRKQHSLRA